MNKKEKQEIMEDVKNYLKSVSGKEVMSYVKDNIAMNVKRDYMIELSDEMDKKSKETVERYLKTALRQIKEATLKAKEDIREVANIEREKIRRFSKSL